MGAVGEAVVSIRADTKEFEREIRAARKELRKLNRSRGLSLGDSIAFSSLLGFVGYVIHVIWG